MNLDYTKVTHEELLEQFRNRLLSDPKFKDLSASSIYQIYMEMMAGTFDMLHFYLGRTAEEMFLDSAKLDSSVIKLSKNLGYNPRRATPAMAEIAITLKGPLPKSLQAGDVIWFNNEKMELSYNSHKFRLDRCYSYTLVEDDIINGVNNSSWSKTIIYSVDEANANGYYDTSTTYHLNRIKAYQCEIKETSIYAIGHASNLGQSYQYYDIDDTKFSNFYGIRDPFAYRNDTYDPLGGWCKIGIGKNKTEAFSKTKICDIEVENVYCNSKVRALNNDLSIPQKLNVCRVESNQDKTVRITFGDGTLVNNGFNNDDEILYVQYVTTDGNAGNTPNVKGNALKNSSQLFAHGGSRIIEVTSNVIFTLNTDIAGGADFESIISMKNNAAVYFAARGQLINKKDFTAYFRTISDPIVAKNAIAWNISDVEPNLIFNHTGDKQWNDDTSYTKENAIKSSMAKARNAVYYTVIGDLYESLTEGQYSPKMLYDTKDDTLDIDTQVGLTTLYNNKQTFMDHISDLSYSLQLNNSSNVNELFTSQTKSAGDPFMLNASNIYKNIDDRLPFGVYPISIPPIVQYYDLVGTVNVSRLANIADYQHEVEAKVYKWLSENQCFNNKIYKSDLIKIFYENAFTNSVNLDITPSSMIYNAGKVLTFGNLQYGSKKDGSYVINTDTSKAGFNVIVIKNQSDEGKSITIEYLEAQPNLDFAIYNGTTKKVDSGKTTISSVEQLDDGRFMINLNGFIPNLASTEFSNSTKLEITLQTETAFAEELTGTNATNTAILAQTHFSNKTSTTATPVELPYEAWYDPFSTKQQIRNISLIRKRFDVNQATDLTEKTFNVVYAPQCTSNLNNDYIAAYRLAKFAIEDSILDDNNNIVNFSLPNEIAVVRLKIDYAQGR